MSPGRLFIPRKGTGDSTDDPVDHRTNYLAIQNWANNAMQETIFSWPGALTTDMSPPWVPQVNTTITNVVPCLIQVATSSTATATSLTFYKNAVAVAPVITPTTTPTVVMFTPPINLKGNADILQAEATVVGTSARIMSAHVRPF